VIVAIDGPAGAGKSTVARRLARRLGAGYLNTGAMYRALTWLALEAGIAPSDGPALAVLAADHPVRLEPTEGGERVLKVYLDATAPERARRRRAELAEAGVHLDEREVLADIERRDHLDRTRAESPLVVADGAVVLDSTGLEADDVVERIAELVARARAEPAPRP
jgi:cytidylate kinase